MPPPGPQVASPASPDPDNAGAAHVNLAAASPSSASITNTTPIIIGVCVGVGCLVLLVVGFRVWKCTRRSKAPLPPKGPLAHDRQRQMATTYAQSDLDFVTPMTHPTPFTSRASLDDHSRQASSRTDVSSIPPSPSVIDSQVHLVQTPSGSEENSEIPRHRRPSFGSSANTARPHLGRKHHSLSYAGSVHSTRSRQSSLRGTIRGAPHARHNRVDIVLPQPLAPGLQIINPTNRQSRMSSSRTSSRERRTEFRGEEWPGRISTDDVSLTANSALAPNYLLPHAGYPPPVPRLPTDFFVSSSPPNAPSHNLADPRTPTSADALLSHYTPSPEMSPAPLPPPKDPEQHLSNRTLRRSESSSHGRPRP